MSATASALYEGRVHHRRHAEVEHRFAYEVHMAYVDLDELPRLLGGRLVSRRPGLTRMRRRDYLGDPRTPLIEAVRDAVAAELGSRPRGPVRMLTNLRTLGHCFNPVTFYYCFGPGGEALEAVVAEVTNTPWRERHAYVIDARATTEGAIVHAMMPKRLHVSPFMGMDHTYRMSIAAPAEELRVRISSDRDGTPAFGATLSLRRTPLTRRNLARVTLRRPASSLRVLAGIYAQALALKLKGASVHPHPRAASR